MSSLRMPAEHGAWGILLVPLVCSAGLAGRWNWPLLLVSLCALSLFLLRGSVEANGHWKAVFQPVHLALAGLGLLSGLLLVLLYECYQLVSIGLLAAALYLIQHRLAVGRAFRKEKRSLAGELVGVVLLTLAAPATWIAALGRLDRWGAQVWLLNLLFFLGGVLYVKYRVRGIAAHRSFQSLSEKAAFAWPVVVYHLLVLGFLVGCVLLQSFPLAVVLAFLPSALRANGLLWHLGRRFPIRRLGWTEVAHSLVFAMLLILTFRA